MPRRLARLAGLVGAMALAACIDITVDGSTVGSIELGQFPWPVIEGGDSLRDSSGKAVPVTVRVFRSDGTADSTTTVTIIQFDTLVRADAATRNLVARSLAFSKSAVKFTANLQATTGSVQSIKRSILVVPTPRLIASASPSQVDTIGYTLPPAPTDTSMALALRVRSVVGTDTVGVSGWPVRYTIRRLGGQVLTATDTTQSFFLIGDNTRASATDTTDDSGLASRRLRFRIRSGQATTDTVRVLAKVGRNSRIVPGDTVSWVVIVRPK